MSKHKSDGKPGSGNVNGAPLVQKTKDDDRDDRTASHRTPPGGNPIVLTVAILQERESGGKS